MTKALIEKKINLILDNVYVERSDNYRFVRNIDRYINRDKDNEVEIELYPEDIDFVNKQVVLLKKLFITLSVAEKNIFKKVLVEKLQSLSTLVGVSVFNALIHTGFFDESFKLIKLYYKSYRDESSLDQLRLLTDVLKNEWQIFSSTQIENIYTWSNDILGGKSSIGRESRDFPSLYRDHVNVWGKLFRQSNAILVKDLDSHLDNGVDLEVNLDKESLTKEFKRFGFKNDLEETLEKIDKKLLSAEDGFDHKNCIDLLRSFTERLYEQIAKTADMTGWRDGDERYSERVAKVFKEFGLISDAQAKMLTSLRHFLSNEGSHRLKSKREDARLSRNMTIEFSLYLIRLLDIKSRERMFEQK